MLRKWWNMKAVVEHDPLSERQIKGKSGECSLHSHEWMKLCTSKRKGAAAAAAAARVKYLLIYCWCHEWGERWSLSSGWRTKTHWKSVRRQVSNSCVIQFIQLFYLHLLCSDSMNCMDFLQFYPLDLYLDIGSTISQLNIDKGVWCLLVTLRHNTRSSPTQHNVP